jgi:hypothetical protein
MMAVVVINVLKGPEQVFFITSNYQVWFATRNKEINQVFGEQVGRQAVRLTELDDLARKYDLVFSHQHRISGIYIQPKKDSLIYKDFFTRLLDQALLSDINIQ